MDKKLVFAPVCILYNWYLVHTCIATSIYFFRPAENDGRLSRATSLVDNNTDQSRFEGPDIEQIPVQLRDTEALVISNLEKTFKALGQEPVKAVKGINLKIYPNEITAILGHNGAGKTTLFNMLTGMTAPTAGTADICG